jgi:hypothetical protein
MYVFIDESGAFCGLNGTASAPSVVGALIVRESRLDALAANYVRLRQHLPKDKGEVKGRQLSERHVAAVIRLLIAHDVLFEATAIDPGMHGLGNIQDHQAKQAAGITANLTDAHHPNVHVGSWDLRRDLEAMSAPLYLQSLAMFDIVQTSMNHASAFWAQRHPEELAAFRWVIDAKHAAEPLTPWERWWSRCVMPILQARSAHRPMMQLEGADYSHFQRFLMDWQPWAFPNSERPTDNKCVNLRLLLTEDFRFSAEIEPGLELVDILTTAVRRALRGSLAHAGWTELPRLMIHRKHQYVSLIAIGDAAETPTNGLKYRRALNLLSKGGRSMLTPTVGEVA